MGPARVGQSDSQCRRSPRLRKAAAAAAVAAMVLLLLPGPGCVETAECDETVPCEGDALCYDYVCRPRCGAGGSCAGPDEVCTPCEEEAARGQINHCREDEAQQRVCVVAASG